MDVDFESIRVAYATHVSKRFRGNRLYFINPSREVDSGWLRGLSRARALSRETRRSISGDAGIRVTFVRWLVTRYERPPLERLSRRETLFPSRAAFPRWKSLEENGREYSSSRRNLRQLKGDSRYYLWARGASSCSWGWEMLLDAKMYVEFFFGDGGCFRYNCSSFTRSRSQAHKVLFFWRY